MNTSLCRYELFVNIYRLEIIFGLNRLYSFYDKTTHFMLVVVC